MITRPIDEMTPVSTPAIAPVVLNRRHVSASSSAGKFADAATAKASPTMNDTFRSLPPTIGDRGSRWRRCRSARDARDARPPRCSASVGLVLADHVRPHVVRDRARRRDDEAGDDREDRRERDRRDDREEDVAADGALAAAEELREVRRRQVAAGARGLDAALTEERARAEAERRGHDVEDADQPDGPDAPTSAPPWRSAR